MPYAAHRYDQANLLRRLLRAAGATRPIGWVYVHSLDRLDRLTFRATRRRTTFTALASGLPIVMLTTTGARSGAPRRHPVIAVPDGDAFVVVGSNYGRAHHPGWYHNLRAHPRVMVEHD